MAHAAVPVSASCTRLSQRRTQIPTKLQGQRQAPSLTLKTSAVRLTVRSFQHETKLAQHRPLRGAVALRHRSQRGFTTRVTAGDGPQMATEDELQLQMKQLPLVVDVRDPVEREDTSRATVPASVNIPLNMDGLKQSQRSTTLEEFKQKLDASGALPSNKSSPIVTHCGSGGRGAKAQQFLKELGYTNVLNGGTPERIVEAITSSSAPPPPPAPKDPFGFGDSGSLRQPTAEEKGSNLELFGLIVGTTIGSILFLFLVFLLL